MRRTVSLCIAILCVSFWVPGASAHHDDADHSPNAMQVGATSVRWPGASVAMSELSFGVDRVVAAVQGRPSAPLSNPGDIPDTGMAVFSTRPERSPAQLGRLECHAFPDVTVWGDLVFQGVVERTETGTARLADRDHPSDPCDRDGLRIISIADPARPKEVAFVPIACGVGEHALVPSGRRLYVYVPSTCQEQADNPFGAGQTQEMAVVRVRPSDPDRSAVASITDIDPMTGCSEVAVVPVRDLAVCSDLVRFVLLDISDRAQPKVIEGSEVVSEHPLISPAFSWDGSYLAVGTNYRTDDSSSVDLYDIEDPSSPVRVSTWNLPQGEGSVDQLVYSLSFVPMRTGQRVLSVAHASRGFWLVDWTDPVVPAELAHYVPSPGGIDPAQPDGESVVIAAYWYNGRFYVTDWDRLRVIKVRGFNRRTVHFFRDGYNPQTVVRDLR